MKGKILLLAIPLLFSCSSTKQQESDPKIPHHSYEDVSDKMVNWQDVFTKGDGYCVYFFSRTCQYCDAIRDEIIEISLTHRTPVYFCNDNAIVRDKYLDVKTTLGMDDITEFRIKGFPSIIKVTNQVINEHCPGKSATLNFIRSIA